jgi:hypothetical protein
MSSSSTNTVQGAYLASRDLVIDRKQTFLALAYRGDDYEKELYYARNIGELKGANARLVSAQAVVDVAVRHGQELGEKRYNLLSEAKRLSEKSKRLDNLGLIALMADRLNTQMPLLTKLSEGELPTQQNLELTHTNHKNSIERIFNLWQKVKSTHSDSAKFTIGFMSETAASLLLERWALKVNITDWVPTFTLLSEDHGNIINGGSKMGWDISIFTDCAHGPTHKLQVKTKYTDSEKTKYENPDQMTGIDFIPISKLWIPSDNIQDKIILPQFILGDLLHEAQGSEIATDRLNDRTEVLLDMFS